MEYWCVIHGELEKWPEDLLDDFFVESENWMAGHRPR